MGPLWNFLAFYFSFNWKIFRAIQECKLNTSRSFLSYQLIHILEITGKRLKVDLWFLLEEDKFIFDLATQVDQSTSGYP